MTPTSFFFFFFLDAYTDDPESIDFFFSPDASEISITECYCGTAEIDGHTDIFIKSAFFFLFFFYRCNELYVTDVPIISHLEEYTYFSVNRVDTSVHAFVFCSLFQPFVSFSGATPCAF